MKQLMRNVLLALPAFLLIVAVSPDQPAVGQAKKDEKKDPPPPTGPKPYKELTCRTTDGLELSARWYNSTSVDPNKSGKDADIVIMVPNIRSDLSKGNWYKLAEAITKEGFAVLAMDWRGHGMNTFKTVGGVIQGNPGVINNKEAFANEIYNQAMFGRVGAKNVKDLEFSKFGTTYWQTLFFDLAAAKRTADMQNDQGTGNSSRIWFVTELESTHLCLAFIHSEAIRNTYHTKDKNLLAVANTRWAVTDYVGLVSLSPELKNTASANSIMNAVRTNTNIDQRSKMLNHLDSFLATMMIHGDPAKDAAGESASRAINSMLCPDAKNQEKNFKWIRHIEKSAALRGIQLVDDKSELRAAKSANSTQDTIVKFLAQVKDKQKVGKEWEQRFQPPDPPRLPLNNLGIRPPAPK